MRARLIARIGTVAAVLALAVGALYATIPDAGGVIHGCYARSTGAIKVIDDSVTTCKQGETAISWNVQGQQGPQGLPGIPGPQGLPGDDHVLTAGTVGNGTAEDLIVADLGTLRVECSATGVAAVTLTGGAPLDVVNVIPNDNDFGASFATSTWTKPPASISDTLWLRNAQGQWQLEYFGFNLYPPGGNSPCRAAVVITRLS